MNEFKQESPPAWGSPAVWGSPAISQTKLPNPSPRQNPVRETPPKRFHSDPYPYHGAAKQKHDYEREQSSKSHFTNSGCVPSISPKNALLNNPGQISSIRFRQQRSHFSSPPYHFGPNSGHSFRTPNQLFSSPVRYNNGRQSFGNVCHKQSPSFSKSCNPGASNQIKNYYQPSMVTDPWKFCKPVVRL